ncbi:MAG: zinc-finger family protein [Rhodocyclales bacterium]|nr:zinc-finger family protein [Rhodocyclales bacterium]
MDCKKVAELLPAYIDQELGVGELMGIDEHLQNCPDCRREHAAQRDLGAQIKARASYFTAPPHLEARLRASLPKSNAAAPRRWTMQWRAPWLHTGIAMACALVAAWSLGLYVMQPSAQERLAEEIVSDHVRSLQVDHLSDVASTDQHTVKPWFNGKLDFAPPVVDLATQGFPLVGGRLDYLDGHAVAALVYHVRQHPINLYVWPASSHDVASTQTRNGYHLMHWTAQGMNFWAISDCAASDVERFAQGLRVAVNEPT